MLQNWGRCLRYHLSICFNDFFIMDVTPMMVCLMPFCLLCQFAKYAICLLLFRLMSDCLISL